jgi:hypothetical protein
MQWTPRSGAKPWPSAVAGGVLAVALGGAVPAAAQEPPSRNLPAGRNLTLPGDRDFILQIDDGDRWTRLAVHSAIEGAFRRLASPACAQVFTDFTDAHGRTLRENLDATGEPAQRYLGLLRYADGSGQAPCARAGILAFTAPGLKIVYTCRAFRDKSLSLRRVSREDLVIRDNYFCRVATIRFAGFGRPDGA